jgi:hypothetical protein
VAVVQFIFTHDTKQAIHRTHKNLGGVWTKKEFSKPERPQISFDILF